MELKHGCFLNYLKNVESLQGLYNKIMDFWTLTNMFIGNRFSIGF